MDDFKMQLLKANLCLLSVDEATETYLSFLIRTAEEELKNKGIQPSENEAYINLVVMYASWLYSKRKSETNEPMPASLRYALQNAWVKGNLK